MKKVLLSLFLAITFLACEGPEGPMGPKGDNGSGTYWYTTTVSIKSSDWILKGNPGDLNSYYFADVAIPELDQDIFNAGNVLAYIKTDEGVKNGLPYVLHMGGLDNNNQPLYWTQTYYIDFSVGYIRFYVTYSDFQTGLSPADEIFYVILMY